MLKFRFLKANKVLVLALNRVSYDKNAKQMKKDKRQIKVGGFIALEVSLQRVNYKLVCSIGGC